MSKIISNLAKSSIENKRTEIDKIDRQLTYLLDQRAKFVFEIGELKKSLDIAVHDPNREIKVIENILSTPHGNLSDGELIVLYKKIIEHYRSIESVHQLQSKVNLSSECRVGFYGFGLMAASVGLGLKTQTENWKFLVFDPFIKVDDFQDWNLKVGGGAFDLVNENQLKDLDYVFLGAPVNVNKEKGPHLAKYNKYVLDLSSVQTQSRGVIGFHPLAGKEISKFYSAQADLLYNKVICITNVESLKADSLDQISQLASALGATSCIVSVEEHNHALAYSSHLVQLISIALGLCYKENLKNLNTDLLPSTAKEFLRLAGSNMTMWKSIFNENKFEILNAISAFESKINEIKSAIEQEKNIETLFNESFKIYEEYYLKRKVS